MIQVVNVNDGGSPLVQAAMSEAPNPSGSGVPVLCREEALVYAENFFRGDRNPADLAALASFLHLLPEGEESTLPFDPRFVLQQVTNVLAMLQSGQG